MIILRIPAPYVQRVTHYLACQRCSHADVTMTRFYADEDFRDLLATQMACLCGWLQLIDAEGRAVTNLVFESKPAKIIVDDSEDSPLG